MLPIRFCSKWRVLDCVLYFKLLYYCPVPRHVSLTALNLPYSKRMLVDEFAYADDQSAGKCDNRHCPLITLSHSVRVL